MTAEPTPEVTEEPTPEVTEEPTPEVTEEPTPEVTAEPTPEVTAEPTPEVTAEPTPEVTEEPTPEPTETGIKVDAVLSDGNACVTISDAAGELAGKYVDVYVAQYDKDGRLICVSVLNTTIDGVFTTAMTVNEAAANVCVFVWEDMQPIVNDVSAIEK